MSSHIDPQVRYWGMWCHLSGLVCTLWPMFVPFWPSIYFALGCEIEMLYLRIFSTLVQLMSPELPKESLGCLLVMPLLMPFLIVLPPLLMILLVRNYKGKLHLFVDAQAKEALNFFFSMGIYTLLALVLFNVLLLKTSEYKQSPGIPTSPFFWLVLLAALAFFPMLTLYEGILVIFAAFKTYHGEFYRYPFTLRFLK